MNFLQNNTQLTIIGEGNIIVGTLNLNYPIRIDGYTKGKVITNSSISIGTTGVCEGTFYSPNVDISGIFNGDIYSSGKVIIRKTGKFTGNLHCNLVEIEDGGFYSGKINSNLN